MNEIENKTVTESELTRRRLKELYKAKENKFLNMPFSEIRICNRGFYHIFAEKGQRCYVIDSNVLPELKEAVENLNKVLIDYFGEDRLKEELFWR